MCYPPSTLERILRIDVLYIQLLKLESLSKAGTTFRETICIIQGVRVNASFEVWGNSAAAHFSNLHESYDVIDFIHSNGCVAGAARYSHMRLLVCLSLDHPVNTVLVGRSQVESG